MFEANATRTSFNVNAQKYWFSQLDWSPLRLQVDQANGNFKLTLSSWAAATDGLNFTIALFIDTTNGFKHKFDFDVLGSPTYNFVPATSSYWNLVNANFHSLEKTGDDDSKVTFGVAKYSWVKTALVDGVNSTLDDVAFTDQDSVSAAVEAALEAKGADADAIDVYCSRTLVNSLN